MFKEHIVEILEGIGLISFAVIMIAIEGKCKVQVKAPSAKRLSIPIEEIKQVSSIVIEKVVESTTSTPKSPHHRVGHIRNLGSRNASPRKIAEALDLGIQLLNNQTLVKPTNVNAS